MKKYINYLQEIDGSIGWAVEETEFKAEHLGKFEVIQSLGNGYLGLRATSEENYSTRHYGLFIGGTFNTPAGIEVPELPNGADILNFTFYVNGELFSLVNGVCENYSKQLDIKHAVLKRTFNWTSLNGFKFNFSFETFVSNDNIHLIAQRVKIIALNADINLMIQTGIDGQITNSGTQHFADHDARFFQKEVLQYVFKTVPNQIDFFYNRSYRFLIDDCLQKDYEFNVLSVYGYDRRKLYEETVFNLRKGQTLVIESFSTINTSRDFDFNHDLDYEKQLEAFAKKLIEIKNKKFDQLLDEHIIAYTKKMAPFWIELDNDDVAELVKIRLATYHLIKMTPWYDSRLNIDAKGWVGEEYKGHTFWDTEIYILPYYIYNDPKRARKLLEHRYFVMPSAFRKAIENNYKGAMWPWETCWKNDGETCPTWGEVDFKTGKRIKVWAAYNELHISADIMWAINLYYDQTNDDDFMERYGYDMLFETTQFWLSKVCKNEKSVYVIKNVTGPNEYKENIDNNAFTNYMVHEGLTRTLGYWNKISKDQTLAKHFAWFATCIENLKDVIANIYLPKPNAQNLINENDTYLSLPEISKFAEFKKHKGSIWLKYTSNELNNYQVNKQADIVCLFYTMPHLFDHTTIIKNWTYYENHTLHGSSLSLSMHATTANMVGETELGYRYFQESLFEFNESMDNCTNGLHAAGIGGILKCITEGFGGINNSVQGFAINPVLPKSWKKLQFFCFIFNNKCHIEITKDTLVVKVVTYQKPCHFTVHEKEYFLDALNQSVEISLVHD